MRVRPAETERADARPARRGALRPLFQARVDVERALLEVDLRVWPIEVQARRQASMAKCQRRLDDARDAGGGVKVPDVGLDRADGAEAAARRARMERLGQGGDFNRIAEIGARPVRLDVRDAVGAHAGEGMRQENGLGLSLHARCGVAHFRRAIVVHGEPADDGLDEIAILDRFGQPLEDHHAHAAAGHRAARVRIERPARPVGRQDRSVGVEVPRFLRHEHADATGSARGRTDTSRAPGRPGRWQPARSNMRSGRPCSAPSDPACTDTRVDR